MDQHITFATQDGVTLHGDLRTPPGGVRRAAVVCHPHPLHGGSSTSWLVPEIQRTLVEAGWASLRFDFRGVHRSGGTWGDGAGELLDVAAALAHVRSMTDEPVLLAGWSFGAAVALRALVAEPEGVAGWIGVGLPLEMEAQGVPRTTAEELQAVTVPLTFVHGTEDLAAPLYRVRALAEVSPAATLVTIEGADHGMQGHRDAVREAIREAARALTRAGRH